MRAGAALSSFGAAAFLAAVAAPSAHAYEVHLRRNPLESMDRSEQRAYIIEAAMAIRARVTRPAGLPPGSARVLFGVAPSGEVRIGSIRAASEAHANAVRAMFSGFRVAPHPGGVLVLRQDFNFH